jgi:nucleotide-binding universal stress UspA family protein
MFEKILVCLDGSELAAQVIPYAAEQASRFKSRVVLLRVVTGTLAIPPTSAGAPAYTGEMVAEQIRLEEKEANEYLEGVARSLREKGLDVETAVLRHPPVGEAVVEYAQQNGVDLIALSSHGHSGLGRLVFGSVADHVLRNSGLPLLVIRPKKTG